MGFGDQQRRNMVAVGSVEAHSARLWFRAERPGSYVVVVRGANGILHGERTVTIAADNPTDNTASLVYPVPGGAPLLPLHRYTFTISAADGTVMVGEGRFETAPLDPAQTPDRFAIGAVSCHQPFGEKGELAQDRLTLLNGLPALFERYDIKFLLALGDQVYGDAPGNASLLNPRYLKSRWPDRGDLGSWTSEQIRAAYQERYRVFWDIGPWLKLMSSYPNYAILDDHEAFDDWGTPAAHQQGPWPKISGAARLAYLDYQGARQLPWSGEGTQAPATLDYQFRYGTVATFVFDLRSERTAGPPAHVLGAGQLARFKTFLAANRDAHVVMLVTSVPLVHLPEWLTAAVDYVAGSRTDFPDHWAAPHNVPDRDLVLAAIREHLSSVPRQRFIVVGGDIHVGCAFELHFVGGSKPLFYELITSAVTNRIKDLEADIGTLGVKAYGLTPRIAGGKLDVSLLKAATGAPSRNPIGGLNAGIIEFHRKDANETNVKLKLIGYDDQHNVREEYASGLL
jgi:alkaline phosphatase D